MLDSSTKNLIACLESESAKNPQLYTVSRSLTKDLTNQNGHRFSFKHREGDTFESEPFEIIHKDAKKDINIKRTGKGPLVPRDIRISAKQEIRLSKLSEKLDIVTTERIKERTSFKMNYYLFEITKVTTLKSNGAQLPDPKITFEFEIELNVPLLKQDIVNKQDQKVVGVIKHFLANAISISRPLEAFNMQFFKEKANNLTKGAEQAFKQLYEKMQPCKPVVGDYLG